MCQRASGKLAGLLLLTLFSLSSAAQKELTPTQKNLQVLLTQSISLLQSNNLAAARERIEKALQLSPNSGQAHYLLGTIHEREGKLQEAVAEYRIALKSSEMAQAHDRLGFVPVSYTHLTLPTIYSV